MTCRRLALPFAAGALLAGCTDPTTPAPPTRVHAAAVAPAGRFVVTFASAGEVPATFATDVAALGGTLETVVGGSGVAAVAGLSDVAAQTLARRSDVAAVGPDYSVTIRPAGSVAQTA